MQLREALKLLQRLALDSLPWQLIVAQPDERQTYKRVSHREEDLCGRQRAARALMDHTAILGLLVLALIVIECAEQLIDV